MVSRRSTYLIAVALLLMLVLAAATRAGTPPTPSTGPTDTLPLGPPVPGETPPDPEPLPPEEEPPPVPESPCKGKAFLWYEECWSASEGWAFQGALNAHGTDGKTFKKNRPELAGIFIPQPWPYIDWQRRVAKRLDRVLCQFGPQCGTGKHYAASGERWRVSPFYVASISGIESTFGQATCASNNAWGILVYCGSGFPSWQAGIDYATRNIRRLIDQGLGDAYSLGSTYCPPCGSNHGKTAVFYMSTFFLSGPGILWKHAVEAVR